MGIIELNLEIGMLGEYIEPLRQAINLQSLNKGKNKNILSESDVGIVKPYDAQVQLIKDGLEDKGIWWKDVNINSIDGFQGQEKEVIILTLVRSNSKIDAGFIEDKRISNGVY
jgi:superfamily I DNA and/or RNA helicase